MASDSSRHGINITQESGPGELAGTVLLNSVPASTGADVEMARTLPAANGGPTTTGGEAAPATTFVMDKTLSTAASLAQLLPTGTVLAFQTLSASFTNRGTCYPSNRYLSAVLIGLCAFSCVFFAFTDSVRGKDGKLYYGFATFRGFAVFNYDGRDDERSKVLGDSGLLDDTHKQRFLDYVHALFSVLLFLAVAFSDLGVQSCFFPKAGTNTKELLVNLPLGAAFLSTMVFLVFPTTRKGIGYSGTARDTPAQ